MASLGISTPRHLVQPPTKLLAHRHLIERRHPAHVLELDLHPAVRPRVEGQVGVPAVIQGWREAAEGSALTPVEARYSKTPNMRFISPAP